VREGLGGQPLALGQREPALGRGDGREHVGVPVRVDDDRDARVVLGAARTMDGPPMSICSTHSSGSAPEATVWVNG
jgi:hypothetical protein